MACIFQKTNGPNVINFSDMEYENQETASSIRLDHAKCLVGHQVQTFCWKINFENVEAPISNHRAFELVERLIQ